MGKMNLSQDDIEKIIKWLEYADRHVELNRDIDEMHGNMDKIDDYIQEHYQIDYLITKLKCK